MLKTLFLLALTTVCSLASGCDDQKGTRSDLPSGHSTAYKLSVITGEDPDSVAKPFKLEARPSHGGGLRYQILSAEQCKNVEIFQEKDTMTIFYDVLALDHFSGDENGEGVPRVLLCDNRYPICQSVRKDYVKRGVGGTSVCTLR